MASLLLPLAGDHRDVALNLEGLDLEACTYTVQPGDRLGELAAAIFPGSTANEVYLPPVGSSIQLPTRTCAFLKGAIYHAQSSGSVGGLKLLERGDAIRWLGDVKPEVGRLGFMAGSYGAQRSTLIKVVKAYVGWKEGDARFEEVTQGRQAWTSYSACGDLWNFALWRLGVRDPEIVNRQEPSAGLKWHPSENLSRPVGAAQKLGAWVPFKSGLHPKPGDLVLIGHYPDEMEHALVFLQATGSSWLSADYGQVDYKSGDASSKFINRIQSYNKLGTRTLVGWIDLDKVPRQAALNTTGVSLESERLDWKYVAAAAVAAAAGVFVP